MRNVQFGIILFVGKRLALYVMCGLLVCDSHCGLLDGYNRLGGMCRLQL
jgi:hypothetical protein